ncbi:hypothetical protein [Corynebacterium auriscanis]|uniref:hypothetical protein n=1 Tax=Corynebacterium auriscanis TaxID=99807 RepID=UPI003CEF0844
MGSVEQIFDNFDLIKFVKDFVGQLFEGNDFGAALSDAGSSQLSGGTDSAETAGSASEALGSLSDSAATEAAE